MLGKVAQEIWHPHSASKHLKHGAGALLPFVSDVCRLPGGTYAAKIGVRPAPPGPPAEAHPDAAVQHAPAEAAPVMTDEQAHPPARVVVKAMPKAKRHKAPPVMTGQQPPAKAAPDFSRPQAPANADPVFFRPQAPAKAPPDLSDQQSPAKAAVHSPPASAAARYAVEFPELTNCRPNTPSPVTARPATAPPIPAPHCPAPVRPPPPPLPAGIFKPKPQPSRPAATRFSPAAPPAPNASIDSYLALLQSAQPPPPPPPPPPAASPAVPEALSLPATCLVGLL